MMKPLTVVEEDDDDEHAQVVMAEQEGFNLLCHGKP